jgi:sterol desaturase/sphingolipid hydroxylase (fatty acid hydroxylase superfamily)
MVLSIIICVAVGLFVIERLWPANQLPKVRAWWARIILVNTVQLGIVILAGQFWDKWMQGWSIISLSSFMNPIWAGFTAYIVSTFIYYWWHRYRHESRFFWRLCHQIHHSPQRIELLTSFYKHPVEILINSVLSSAIVYLLLGCSVEAAGVYTIFIAVAEFFYHWNITTPRWLGYIIQRPESHRIHHKYRHHTKNFADLPLWDWMFGTLDNARGKTPRCGFDDWRADRFDDMIAFRDVHSPNAATLSPLHLLPTCVGCSKRWACEESRRN